MIGAEGRPDDVDVSLEAARQLRATGRAMHAAFGEPNESSTALGVVVEEITEGIEYDSGICNWIDVSAPDAVSKFVSAGLKAAYLLWSSDLGLELPA